MLGSQMEQDPRPHKPKHGTIGEALGTGPWAGNGQNLHFGQTRSFKASEQFLVLLSIMGIVR